MIFKVGSRKSKLALVQTQIVINSLKRINSSEFITVPVTTKGDRDMLPLFSLDSKGIFEREIDTAVVNGGVDFAIHSLKDIPSDLHDELVIASIPKRAEPNDVLISKDKKNLTKLPNGAIVGTSSLRRAIQILRKNPSLKVKPIRGNIETRVSKIGKECDAIVLASAGITRLKMDTLITEKFDLLDFVPAPGQGAIAIVCRRDNLKLIKLLQSIEDTVSRKRIDAERAMIQHIESGCRFPVGAIATYNSKLHKLVLHASIFSADGKKNIRVSKSAAVSNSSDLGKSVAKVLIEKGVSNLAEGWRQAIEDWNIRK
jgi:hydroxymethylbilane synthase